MTERYFALYSGSLENLTMDERIVRYEKFRSPLGIEDLEHILSHDYGDCDTIVTMVVE